MDMHSHASTCPSQNLPICAHNCSGGPTGRGLAQTARARPSLRCTYQMQWNCTCGHHTSEHLSPAEDDRADLIQALLASCHLPVLSDGKMVTKFRGKSAEEPGLCMQESPVMLQVHQLQLKCYDSFACLSCLVISRPPEHIGTNCTDCQLTAVIDLQLSGIFN
eukprot:973983-Pelagomonas_calceolata.AAC.8